MAHNDNSNKDTADATVSEETLLKLSKEIAVKFIEVGRITPATFPAAFKDIHAAIKDSLGRDKA
jgi:hypothetical protein